MNISKIIIAVFAVVLIVEGSAQNINIRWMAESTQFVTRGTYARIKKVNNQHALVYESGGAVWIRLSHDGCNSWSEATEVARGEGYGYANSELLQLQSGKLIFTWNARPKKGSGLPYKIMYATSIDQGRSWSKGCDLYVAGTTPRSGCWEPIPLQLPTGELHIYFANEKPYTESDEQEISLIRSFDEGKTWGDTERVSFRTRSRDGMPVPIYLPHSKEIVVAIEDNGIRGRFKPVIVRSAYNWHDSYVRGNDTRREEAVGGRWAIQDTVYAGAPYLIRLGENNTLLSVQSTEGRKGGAHHFANMQVYVGNKDARNFRNRTTPLPQLPSDGSALWSSLAQIDDETVIAVMSVRGLETGKNGVWTIKGKIIKRR
jgi:hypothetical protein